MPAMTSPHERAAANAAWSQDQPQVQQPGPTWAQTQEVLTILKSVRAMLVFFTVLAVLGLIGGVIGVVALVHAANSSSTGL